MLRRFLISGGWDQEDANNADNIMPRTGYLFTCAGCPLLWCIRLQMEIALSATRVEYIALIQGMSKVIPFMMLMKELSFISNIHLPNI